MNELIAIELEDCKDRMNKAVSFTESELTKIRAGKATPSMFDGLSVDYYGAMTPLSQVSNINTTDARTIIIQPWEKTLINAIEKAIIDANLGVNPQNDGVIVRIVIPPLTEERRRDLVKKVKDEAEKGRVSVRNIRKETNEAIKKLKNDGASEDEIKIGEAEVQKLTDSFATKVDALADAKEKDIMTI